MKRHLLIILLLITILHTCGEAHAQSLLQAQGDIPADFKRTARHWYDSQTPARRYGSIVPSGHTDTLMLLSCQLADILSSGRCLYGDSLTLWVQQQVSVMQPTHTPRCYLYRHPSDSIAAARLWHRQILLFTPRLFQGTASQARHLLCQALSLPDTVGTSIADTSGYAYAQQAALRELRYLEQLYTPNNTCTADPYLHPLPPFADTDPVICVAPRYQVLDADGRALPRRTYRRRQQLSRDLQLATYAASRQMLDYSPTGLCWQNTSLYYNTYSLLSDWSIAHAANNHLLLAPAADSLFRRLGTPWVFFVEVSDQEGLVAPFPWSAAALGTIYPPATVGLVTHMLSHVEQTSVHATIVHAPQGRTLTSISHSYPLKDEHTYIRTTMFDAYLGLLNPGYLGHRVALSLGVEIGTPGLASTLASASPGAALRPFEANPSIGIEASLFRHWSAAVGMEFNATHLYLPTGQNAAATHWWPVAIHTLDATLRYYRHPSPAPVGGYLGAGITASRLHPKALSPDISSAASTLNPFYALRLLWGRNYIYANRTFLQFSLAYDFPFVALIGQWTVWHTTPQPSATTIIVSDIWHQNFFSVGLKFGWMP